MFGRRRRSTYFSRAIFVPSSSCAARAHYSFLRLSLNSVSVFYPVLHVGPACPVPYGRTNSSLEPAHHGRSRVSRSLTRMFMSIFASRWACFLGLVPWPSPLLAPAYVPLQFSTCEGPQIPFAPAVKSSVPNTALLNAPISLRPRDRYTPYPFAFRCTPSTIMISSLSPTWYSFIECPTWSRPLPRCWNHRIDGCTIKANEWAVYHRRGMEPHQ